MVKVNALGDPCPIPVVKTKNAIKDLKEGGVVEILVDNEIAVQNLTKMAKQMSYGIQSKKLSEGVYQVLMEVGQPAKEADKTVKEIPETESFDADVPPLAHKKKTVVVISSDKMGEGSDELGHALMKSFLFALSKLDVLPDTILFYNGGAHFTVSDSPALEDIKAMEAEGVTIMTCGTCLNHYGLTEQLAVGSITNMYTIAEIMMEADHIIKP